MRFHYLLTLLIMLLVPFAEHELYAQQSEWGRVLILVPKVIGNDVESRSELRNYDTLDARGGALTAEEGEDREAVLQIIANRNAIVKKGSYPMIFAIAIQELLLYSHGALPGMIPLIDEHGRQGHTDSLRAIALTDSMDYILALDSLVISRKGGHWYATLGVALYEATSDSLILKLQARGDDKSTNESGVMFSSQKGTLDCAIVNCVQDLWVAIIDTIHRPDPEILQGQ